MRNWLEALWMWGVGRLQVHGIRSRRLVHKEVVDVWSNYKKSYFWWYWLLLLNPRARGEHLTSQLSWVAAWLLAMPQCLPSLPGGRTLLFWSDLFVGRMVCWERLESSELGRSERCIRVVRWQGEKGGRIVRWQDRRGGMVVRWQVGKRGRVVRWQGGESGRSVRWQAGRFLVLFQDGGQNYVALLHGSEMEAELHYRDLILLIQWFRFDCQLLHQWPNG